MSAPEKYANNCPQCGGTGKVLNPTWLRARRIAAGITLREMADRIGYSAPYLCDIELGRRHCTTRVAAAYEALEAA